MNYKKCSDYLSAFPIELYALTEKARFWEIDWFCRKVNQSKWLRHKNARHA